MAEWGTHYLDLSEETRQELLLYLGKNDETYEKRWTKMSEKRHFFSWNWSAFFAFTFWSVHRKMYYLSYGYLILYAISGLFTSSISDIANLVFSLLIAILFALFSNYFCFVNALTAIKKLKAEIPDRSERILYLHSHPGYSWPAFWIYLLIDIAVTAAINFI
jgi:hypothetical protein